MFWLYFGRYFIWVLFGICLDLEGRFRDVFNLVFGVGMSMS